MPACRPRTPSSRQCGLWSAFSGLVPSSSPCLCLQAQNSFGQYFAPIFLVFSILEANTVLSPTFLYALGGLITVARVAHAAQLSFPDQIPIQARLFGFLTTCLFFVVAGGLCFLVGLQVSPLHSPPLAVFAPGHASGVGREGRCTV